MTTNSFGLPTDNDDQFLPPGNVAYIPTDNTIQNHYEVDGKVYAMGITNPEGFDGQSVAFCQLASPVLIWIADWTMAQWGDIPDIPDPKSVDSQWQLLDTYYGTMNIMNNTGGETVLYRISGTYVYAHKNPPMPVIMAVKFGKPTWLNDSFTRYVSTSYLVPNLVEPQTNQAPPPSSDSPTYSGPELSPVTPNIKG